MTPEERAVLERSRVGRLATADADGRPHVVPVCYALVGDPPTVVTPVDEKPKSTPDLQRVRDVRANPRATLVVDHYDEDWSRLAWVQVRGRARVLGPGDSAAGRDTEDPLHPRAVDALTGKYDQYADHALGERPAIAVEVERTVSWGALEEWT